MKYTLTNVRLEPELKKRLRAYCYQTEISQNDVFIVALLDYLEKYEHDISPT